MWYTESNFVAVKSSQFDIALTIINLIHNYIQLYVLFSPSRT